MEISVQNLDKNWGYLFIWRTADELNIENLDANKEHNGKFRIYNQLRTFNLPLFRLQEFKNMFTYCPDDLKHILVSAILSGTDAC